MRISNKTTAPVIMAITIPLLILGGCAGHETVKISQATDFSTSEEIEQNEALNETVQDTGSFISVVPEQESSEVVEPVESALETPVEENIATENATPKPEEGIIGFAFDESDINDQYSELLWQHAQYLIENENLILNISGHTDSSGARVYNEMLSKKRANQVANILIEYGVPEDRIKVTGNASDQPLAGAINNRDHRRVELDYQDQQLVSN